MIVIEGYNDLKKAREILTANGISFEESEHAWAYICEKEMDFYISETEFDEETIDFIEAHQEDITSKATEYLKNCEHTIMQFMESVADYANTTIKEKRKELL